jgi:hypothetical protein
MLDIKDNDSAGSRKANWGLLVAELKNFAIDLDSGAQQRIQEGNTKQL